MRDDRLQAELDEVERHLTASHGPGEERRCLRATWSR